MIFNFKQSLAVIFREFAAVSEYLEDFHKIEEHPSGEITELNRVA